MEQLDLPGWQLEYDRAETAAASALAPATGPEVCGCEPCLNWAATREQLLPAGFRGLLEQLGVPFNREAEVYHNCRLESGLHSYGAWYHFVGRVLFGEIESSPKIAFGSFSVYFHSSPVLVSETFAGKPVVQLELVAEVPWLSDIAEAP